ncbi:hypothetical protein U9M48_014441 [Paspalum notatum var. saurae]|uniref:Transposase n=1 Tax=Paspalum notatum var. saurae TaxID=547442 RepID=A0AAQ3WKG8_PASNO
MMMDMLNDLAMGFEFDPEEDNQPPPEVQEFYRLLEAGDEKLYDHTEKTMLDTVSRLMAIKSKHNISNSCFNDITELVFDVIPSDHKLPKNLYFTKKMMAGLGMKYEKIDVCPSNCMLFWREDDKLSTCRHCGKSRYIQVKNEAGDNADTTVPAKQLRYMSIIPCLKRLFLYIKIAKSMRWHKERRRGSQSEDVMVHPADGDAWKTLDEFDPEFARDPRSVRLGLATDGFTPFSTSASPYSCWPVFIMPHNLPPEMVLKDEFVFFALVVPRPEHLGKNLNAFLHPLIEELKQLWTGVKTRYYTDTDQDDREAMKALKRHFSKDAEKVIHDSLYNARITAVCRYYKSVKVHRSLEVVGQVVVLTGVDGKVREQANQQRAGSGAQKAESGTKQNFINVYLRGHRGADPNNTDVLCSQAAKDKLDRYGQEMVKRHGEGVQWMQQPLDVDALYHNSEGRRHGRFTFGTGVVDYNRSVSRVGSSSTSKATSRRSRVNDAQEEAREAREEARQAREDARQTREQSQQALAYMSSFMQQLSASLGPEVNLPPFCPPIFTSQQGQQPPQTWTQPQGPQGSGGWPAWPEAQASQIVPQGSQMPPQGFQPPMGWMQPGSFWAPGPDPNYGLGFSHFRVRRYEHYIKLSNLSNVSGSHLGNVTPDAEVDPNEYLRHSAGGSGSGHNSNNPQSGRRKS